MVEMLNNWSFWIALTLVNALVWYIFICYLLYSIRHKVSIYKSGFILLVLCYIGIATCPVVWYGVYLYYTVKLPSPEELMKLQQLGEVVKRILPF